MELLRRHQVFEELERYESPDLGIWIIWFEVVKVRVDGHPRSLVTLGRGFPGYDFFEPFLILAMHRLHFLQNRVTISGDTYTRRDF